MEREVYKNMTGFRKALTDVGVILAAKPEHIGNPKENHWPDDHDGIEHWHIKGEVFRSDGTPEPIWIGYWKDVLGHLGDAPGSIYPDRVGGAMNKVKPVVVESVPDEAVALVKELPNVLPGSVVRAGSSGGCSVVQAAVLEAGVAIPQRYIVYTDEGGQRQVALFETEG